MPRRNKSKVSRKSKSPKENRSPKKSKAPIKERSSRSKNKIPIPENTRSKRNSPMPERSRSKSQSPMPERSRSKNKIPIPENTRSKRNSPMPERSRSKSQSPMPERSRSKNKIPIPENTRSKRNSPMPERSRSKSQSPMPERSRSKRKIPMPQSSRSKSKSPMPESSKNYLLENERTKQRLPGLEKHERGQEQDKLANMAVKPDVPTAGVISRDGFKNQGQSSEEQQKGNQAVQPRMLRKQALATHTAECDLTQALQDLHELLASRPPDTSLAPPPRDLRTALMPHQLHALAWLRWRETQRPTGGILADDIDLGKSLTMISLVVSEKETNIDKDDESEEGGSPVSKLSRGGTLLVCPASLRQQWSAEVSKHCAPRAVSMCLHHGAARARHPHLLAKYDLVITTYNILQRDSEKNGVLMKVLWRRIILDEAHTVRNYKSATFAAASALKGKRRWCLTGTPLQNKDLDLFALLKFLRCMPFDDLTKWKKWIDNKSEGQDRLNTILQCILLLSTKETRRIIKDRKTKR